MMWSQKVDYHFRSVKAFGEAYGNCELLLSCSRGGAEEERWRGAMATRDGERVLLVSCLISQIISLCACFRRRILPGLGTNCTYSNGSTALGECKYDSGWILARASMQSK